MKIGERAGTAEYEPRPPPVKEQEMTILKRILYFLTGMIEGACSGAAAGWNAGEYVVFIRAYPSEDLDTAGLRSEQEGSSLIGGEGPKGPSIDSTEVHSGTTSGENLNDEFRAFVESEGRMK